MRQRTILTLDDAQKVVSAILAELVNHERGAAVAVVDEHGELLAFARTDKCPLPSVNIAQNKAYTAARQRDETANIGKKGYPMTNFGDLRYCPWGGGVPIRVGGEIIGAVGVSGLPEADDVILAKMGAALIGDE